MIIPMYTSASAPLATPKKRQKEVRKSGLTKKVAMAPLPPKNTRKCKRLNFFLWNRSIDISKKRTTVTMMVSSSKLMQTENGKTSSSIADIDEIAIVFFFFSVDILCIW